MPAGCCGINFKDGRDSSLRFALFRMTKFYRAFTVLNQIKSAWVTNANRFFRESGASKSGCGTNN